MIYWSVRHLMSVFLIFFIVFGFFYQDELFDNQAMQAVSAIVEVAPKLAVTQIQPEVVAEAKAPAEYIFRPEPEPETAAEPYELPNAPLIPYPEPVYVAPPSDPVAEPVAVEPMMPDAMIPDVMIPGPITPTPIIPDPVAVEPMMPEAITPEHTRSPEPHRIPSILSPEPAALIPMYDQSVDFIPHSYSVQPPELLRSPAADFPDAEPMMPSGLGYTPMAPMKDFQATLPSTTIPDIFPRQQTLSHGLIEPHYEVQSDTGVGLGAPEAASAAAKKEVAHMGPALDKARAAFWMKNFAQSEQLYIDLIKHFPESGNLFGELGNVYYAQGRMAQAAVVWSESIVRLARQNKLRHAKFTLDMLWRIDPHRARLLVGQVPSLAQ